MTTTQALTLGQEDQRFICVLDWEEDTGWSCARWSAPTIWVNWKLYSVANTEGPPEVFVSDDGVTRDFSLASLRAEGHVKWGGCHEFEVGDYHGCRPEDLEHFLAAIRDATRAAASHLTSSECDWGGP